MQEEDNEADGAEGDTREEEEGQQGDEEPEELPPASRNVIMQARPEVFATLELITLIGVAVYVHHTPKPAEWPLRLRCRSLDCFNLQSELHGSMDLVADPCNDFYQYVCGHWAEGHAPFEDQFRYLEAKVYWAANEKLRDREALYPDPTKPLTTTDKAILSYVACVEVQRKDIDVPWLIDKMLFIGREKPGHFLARPAGKHGSSEVLSMLIRLAMDYDLDVLFEMTLAPDARSENRSVLVVGHSPSLIRWKRHRERYLTPESTARCVDRFVNVMSCDCALDTGTAAAVVAMDSEVTAKMAAAAAFSTSETGRRFKADEWPSTRAAVWVRIVRKNLLDAVKERDNDRNAEEPNPPAAGRRHVREGSASKWNLSDEHLEVYTSDPKIFGLVDESLSLHPDLHVRYFVAFHVVRALAPFASHRLTRLLFSDDNVTAAMLYAADVCAMASSKLTSFALANFVFRDVLSPRRVQLAHDQVEAIRNETLGSLSWLGESGQRTAHKRLASLRSLVAWPKRLNASDAMDAYFAVLPDFRGYYVELYLDSVATLRRREKARLLLLATGHSGDSDNDTDVADGSVMFEGLRPTVRYSASRDRLFISPGALFEPFLFTTLLEGSSAQSAANDSTSSPATGPEAALALASLGHLVAHELWHAALGDRPLGASPQQDLTMNGTPVRRHACLTTVYKAAAGLVGNASNATAAGSPFAKAASENLADVAGLQVAYALYKAASSGNPPSTGNGSDAAAQSSWISRVTGFGERELFFIGSCFKWCAAVADDVVPGSLGFTPARLRCNVPVALTDGFGETFGCKKEHRMSQIAANYSCMAPGDVIGPLTLSDNTSSTASTAGGTRHP